MGEVCPWKCHWWGKEKCESCYRNSVVGGSEKGSFYGKGEERCESYSHRMSMVSDPEKDSFWEDRIIIFFFLFRA